jgi:hypothetical protein
MCLSCGRTATCDEGAFTVGRCRNLWGGTLCPGAEGPREECVAFGANAAGLGAGWAVLVEACRDQCAV